MKGPLEHPGPIRLCLENQPAEDWQLPSRVELASSYRGRWALGSRPQKGSGLTRVKIR
jgi:hypothetical protein